MSKLWMTVFQTQKNISFQCHDELVRKWFLSWWTGENTVPLILFQRSHTIKQRITNATLLVTTGQSKKKKVAKFIFNKQGENLFISKEHQ